MQIIYTLITYLVFAFLVGHVMSSFEDFGGNQKPETKKVLHKKFKKKISHKIP